MMMKSIACSLAATLMIASAPGVNAAASLSHPIKAGPAFALVQNDGDYRPRQKQTAREATKTKRTRAARANSTQRSARAKTTQRTARADTRARYYRDGYQRGYATATGAPLPGLDILGDILGGTPTMRSTPQAVSACARTYRSFDPNTGYVMTRNGPRICPYLAS